MIYRGPDFLAVICFGSSPHPPFPSVSSTANTQEDRIRERQLADVRDGGGAQPYDDQKAWSSTYKSFNTLCVHSDIVVLLVFSSWEQHSSLACSLLFAEKYHTMLVLGIIEQKTQEFSSTACVLSSQARVDQVGVFVTSFLIQLRISLPSTCQQHLLDMQYL